MSRPKRHQWLFHGDEKLGPVSTVRQRVHFELALSLTGNAVTRIVASRAAIKEITTKVMIISHTCRLGFHSSGESSEEEIAGCFSVAGALRGTASSSIPAVAEAIDDIFRTG